MIPWQKAPFFRPTIMLLLGILAYGLIGIEIGTLLCTGILLSILTLFCLLYKNQFPIIQSTILLILFFILGWTLHAVHNFIPSDHFSHWQGSDKDLIIGELTKEPKKKNWYHTELRVIARGDDSINMRKCAGKLSLFLSPKVNVDITAGDTIAINSKIHNITSPANPYQIDFSKQNKRKGIYHQAFVYPHQISLLGKNEVTPWVQKARKIALQQLQKHTKDPKTYGILAAMIVGVRDGIPAQLKEAFADTGAIHTLAVSGLHVGIIALFINILLFPIPSRSAIGKSIKTILSIMAIWLFALLAGASPSVIRATIMFSLFTIDFHWTGSKNAYNFLAFSAFIMCLYDPTIVYQISFQFSFLALLSILLFYKKIYQLLPPLSWAPLKFIWGLTAVSLAAQVLLLPLSIYYFHQLPVYFWLSSLWAIPLTYLIVSCGVLVLGLSFISDILADWGFMLLEKIILLLSSGIEFCHLLPYNVIKDIWLWPWQVMALYGFIAIITAYIYTKHLTLLKSIQMTALFFLLVLMIQDWHNCQQSKIIMLHHSGKTSLYVVDGKQLISLTTRDKLYQSKMIGTIKNMKMQHNLQEIISIAPDSTKMVNRSYHRSGIFMHKNKVIMLPTFGKEEYHGQVDYLVLNEENHPEAENLVKKFRPKTIITDKEISSLKEKNLRNISRQNPKIIAMQNQAFLEINI